MCKILARLSRLYRELRQRKPLSSDTPFGIYFTDNIKDKLHVFVFNSEIITS